MAHKTNYKDALFEQRKYRMQNNPDGTVTPIDETDYTQKGDRVGALELNEIGKALNALEQEMGKRELQTYTALSQLSLEAPVTLSQLITAMPDGSYAAIDCNGTSVVSDIPSGSAAGSLEVVKVGDSGSAKYTNTSNGQVYFWGNGQWYAALVDEMVLGTMEEIDANTDAGKVAGALAVKELSSEINGINGKLYNDSIAGTTSMSLKDAVKHVCDNYVGLNSSARGRFNCAEGWYDYDLIKSVDDYCSGFLSGHAQSAAYQVYRSRGADAVLKKLGSNIVYIGNSTSIDVKTVLPNDYANLTADNFIVELASLSANGGAANTGGASYPQFGSVNANSNMTKTYNNGVLTIQGIACSGETYNGDRAWRRYVSASAGIRVYAVY